MTKLPSKNEWLFFAFSTLINIMITAFTAPIGPIIAALLVGIAIGATLVIHNNRTD